MKSCDNPQLVGMLATADANHEQARRRQLAAATVQERAEAERLASKWAKVREAIRGRRA